MPRFDVRAFTDVGLRRERNEDAVLVVDWISQSRDGSLASMDFDSWPPRVCAVADGMGGHAGGDLASRTALTGIARAAPDWRSPEDIEQTLQRVNEQVHAAGQRHNLTGLGTTVAGVAFLADRAVLFNIGDSRSYGTYQGRLHQISVDHAVRDAAGRATNVITQALGQDEPVDPHIVSHPVLPGRLLLCSDGVSGLMSQEELTAATHAATVEGCAQTIVDTTRRRGATDNFSFILVDVSVASQ